MPGAWKGSLAAQGGRTGENVHDDDDSNFPLNSGPANPTSQVRSLLINRIESPGRVGGEPRRTKSAKLIERFSRSLSIGESPV